MSRKTTLIQADKARNLSYPINTLIEIEDYFKKPIGDVINSMDEISFRLLRTLLYFGLKWEDKTLTEQHTGEVMQIAIENIGMQELAQLLAQAMTDCIGQSTPPSR